MNWSEVTAVFGGTFDPPHLGHFEAVKGLFTNPGVKRVIIMPSASPPHKPSNCSIQDRLKMAELCFQSRHFLGPVLMNFFEIEASRKNPSKLNYSFNTIQALSQEIPSQQLAFVIGTDQLEKFHTWYRFPEVMTLCHWIVLKRTPLPLEPALKEIQQFVGQGLLENQSGTHWKIKNSKNSMLLVDTPAPGWSSTQIRESITKTGQIPTHSLHPDVETYLKALGLYGTKREMKGSA